MQGGVSLYAGNLGRGVGGEVELVVGEAGVGVGVAQAEEARVGAGAERDDLLGGGRVGSEEAGDEQVEGGGADVGAWGSGSVSAVSVQ